MRSIIRKSFSVLFILCFMLVGLGLFGVAKVNATTLNGVINFGSGSGRTKINGDLINCNDSLDNQWTITTVGTTSYTQNESYSQVGSSSYPATSITFSTTLPNSETISSFSAKFGGFSGTAGAITLKVDDETVGTGSLNKTSDVIIENTKSADGTILTIVVNGISKGVKCYYIRYTCGLETKVLESISVKPDTVKSTYSEGDYFDPTDLVIIKNFDDSSEEELEYAGNESSFSFSPTSKTPLTTAINKVQVTVSGQTADIPITVNTYSGVVIPEADYIIYYGDKAMNATITSERLQYNNELDLTGGIVSTDDETIIWHIVQSINYVTLYNASTNKYASSTGVSAKVQLLSDGTTDYSKWIVDESDGKYDFINKYNFEHGVNHYLRNNSTYGFSCYSDSYGGKLTLYRVCKITFNGNGSDGGTTNASIYSSYGTDTRGLPNCTYTKTGKVFYCWNTQADGLGTSYNAEDAITNLTADVTLYAQWVEVTTHNVDFYDSMTGEKIITKEVVEGEKVNATGIGEKFGYNIEGWFTKNGKLDDDWGTEFDLDTAINSNEVLYAKYSELSWKTSFELLETRASLKYDITHYSEGWYEVTNTGQLNVGDQVIIVAANANYAMSTTQNTNNRGRVSVSKSENEVSFDTDVQIFTLEEGTEDNTYAFYTGSGYIYAAGANSNNYLKTQVEKDGNASFKISISAGVTSVIAKGSSSKNVLQYNSGSGIFSCYGTASQQAVTLYKYYNNNEVIDYAAIRFGIRLTAAEYALYTSKGTLGVEVEYNKGFGLETHKYNFGTTRPIARVNASGEADPEGDYYQFAVVLNGLQKYTGMDIQAKVYITDGDSYIYTQKAGTTNNAGNDYSFSDMINYYYDNRVSLGLDASIITSLEKAKGILEP